MKSASALKHARVVVIILIALEFGLGIWRAFTDLRTITPWYSNACNAGVLHHMAQVHAIKEIRGDHEFLVYNQYTGEKNVVTVDSDKYDLFSDTVF